MIYGQITCMLFQGETVACAILHRVLRRASICGRASTLERDRKRVFSENLCHHALSLSNVDTQEIGIA